jgi:hypothetical protein
MQSIILKSCAGAGLYIIDSALYTLRKSVGLRNAQHLQLAVHAVATERQRSVHLIRYAPLLELFTRNYLTLHAIYTTALSLALKMLLIRAICCTTARYTKQAAQMFVMLLC